MNTHIQNMENLRMSRSDYLGSIRRQQPISELERKKEKAYRAKGKIFTIEDIDLACAKAVKMADFFRSWD